MTTPPKPNSDLSNNQRAHAGNWLTNILVGWKLTLVVTILLVGTILVFASAYLGFQELNHQISNMYNITLLPVTALDRADISLGVIETRLVQLRNPALTVDDIAASLNAISDSENTYTGILRNYHESSQNSDFTQTLASQDGLGLQKQERTALDAINQYYASYSARLATFRNIYITNGRIDDQSLSTTTAAVSATRNYLRQLSDINRRFADVTNKAAARAYQQALVGMASTMAVSSLIGLLLAFIVARSIITRLRTVALASQYIQEGQLEQRATAAVGGRDEIAQMALAVDTMAEQLTQNLNQLELRVADRTAELEKRSQDLSDRTTELETANIRVQKRAGQFQSMAEVSRTTTAIHDLGSLLPRIATVVSEQFGYYHVGIFLLDDSSQFAVLSASNSAGGRRMLARNHRLKVGAQGIVGNVMKTGDPRIASHTDTDAVFYENPDLPATRSELVVPLRTGEKIIGALDVQSEQAEAFSQEDSDIFQILADQISIAIDNARQYDQTQKALGEAETIYRQYVRHEWDRLSDSDTVLGYRNTSNGTQAIDHTSTTDQAEQVFKSGEILVEGGSTGKEASLLVPIKLRDEVIGILNIRAPQKRAWNNDEINLVKAVADRVAISAENARLFEETTDRAERERTVSQITSKIRSTNDPNQMIQIALEELKQALHVKDARILPIANPQNPE